MYEAEYHGDVYPVAVDVARRLDRDVPEYPFAAALEKMRGGGGYCSGTPIDLRPSRTYLNGHAPSVLRPIVFICLAAILLSGCDKKDPPLPPAANADEGIGVFFKPDDCRREVIRRINHARSRIQVQAYSFTSDEIADARRSTPRRKIKVEVIIDSEKGTSKKSELDTLRKKGIDTWVDSKHEKAHSKIIIIDGETLITGSFNFTDQKEDTADNLLVINNKPKLVASYLRNFEEHKQHSKNTDPDALSILLQMLLDPRQRVLPVHVFDDVIQRPQLERLCLHVHVHDPAHHDHGQVVQRRLQCMELEQTRCR